MKQVYEISKVKTLVTYARYAVNEKGEKILEHTQTRVHEGLPTKEELIAEAKTRCLPEYNIEVVVDNNLKE